MFCWCDQICFFATVVFLGPAVARVLPILFDYRSLASHLVYFCRPMISSTSPPWRLRVRRIFRCQERDKLVVLFGIGTGAIEAVTGATTTASTVGSSRAG